MNLRVMISTMAVIGLIAGSTVYAESAGASTDLKLAGVYVSPKQSGWDNGIGGELQLIQWANPNVGIAIAGGCEQWKTSKSNFDFMNSSTDDATGLNGDSMFYPVGASVLGRLEFTDSLSLSLEGGLRYVIANSDVTASVGTGQANKAGTTGIVMRGSKLTLDNGVIGKAAADLNFKMSEEATLSIGAGYDFDISKGDVHGLGQNLGTYSLEGFFVRVGLSIRI